MSEYKVPQDVEADDKLVGPFTFRQLIYLFISAGLIGLSVLLFQIFPLLAAIPVPFIIFLLILSSPFKKDQPMEVYLAALINFYIKPNKRFWNPGQRESTIVITAPKKIEGPRIRAISEDEATHRLSFLADIIDSNGQSIRENWNSSVQEEYITEAASTPDIYENYNAETLTSRVADQTTNSHKEAIEKMRAAIADVEGTTAPPVASIKPSTPTITHGFKPTTPPESQTPFIPPSPQQQSPIIEPIPSTQPNTNTQTSTAPVPPAPAPTLSQNPARVAAIEQLSTNTEYSVATIAKEANRINNNDNNEVFISLH